MVESPRGSDPSSRSLPPSPPPPNAVLAASGVEPHPEPRPTSAFGANDVYDVLGSDDALKAEVEAATAALRADLKATSDRLAELETGAALQELDGMQGELAKTIRAWREEMYGGTMEALSELEALKLAIEKGGSLDADVVRMVEELAATKLEANELGAVHPPELAAALASIGDTDTIEGVESWIEGLAARVGAEVDRRSGGQPRRECDRHDDGARSGSSGRWGTGDRGVVELGVRRQPRVAQARGTRAAADESVRSVEVGDRAVRVGVGAFVRSSSVAVPVLQRVRASSGTGPRLRRRGAGVSARSAAR